MPKRRAAEWPGSRHETARVAGASASKPRRRSVSVADGLVRVLSWRARHQGNGAAYVFCVGRRGATQTVSYAELAERVHAIANGIRATCGEGERVLVVMEAGRLFVEALLGCFVAGVVAVPTHPVSALQSLHARGRLQRIASNCEPSLVIYDGGEYDGGEKIYRELEAFQKIARVNVRQLHRTDTRSIAPESGVNGVALLQYTSGSTSEPKGVIVTHENLAANARNIEEAFDLRATDVVASWLPPHHDMGLVGGVLQPIFSGIPCILMTPLAFLRAPGAWLAAISDHRATVSGAPNFGYDLCTRRVPESEICRLDLSSWRVAFNGAEPVSRRTMSAFSKRFASAGFRPAAFVPCYGLAEATLLVSAARRSAEETDGAELGAVSVGGPPSGLSVSVRALESLSEPAGAGEGEIWISGATVARGYWGEPAASGQTFFREGDVTWLRTGDLGRYCRGQLYVTGRLKELIVVRGRNVHPEDIEAAVAATDECGVAGPAVAFGAEANGREGVVLVWEVPHRLSRGHLDALATRARAAIASDVGVSVDAMVFTPAGAIPRTTSGKLRRTECRRQFLERSLRRSHERHWSCPLAADEEVVASRDLRSAFLEIVARSSGAPRSEIDEGAPIGSLGLDSINLVDLRGVLLEFTGLDLSLEELVGRSISEIASTATRSAPPAPLVPAASVDDSPSPVVGSQRDMWLYQTRVPGGAAFNLPVAFRTSERIDENRLRRAVGALASLHPTLRTRVAAGDDTVLQDRGAVIDKAVLEIRSSVGLSDDALLLEIAAAAAAPFDLALGPPLRLAVWRGATADTLLLVVHHIAADLRALEVVLEDLAILYVADPQEVSALTRQESSFASFMSFTSSANTFAGSSAGEECIRYWRSRFQRVSAIAVPDARPIYASAGLNARAQDIRLPVEVTERLRDVARAEHTTLFATLLAVFQAVRAHWCDSRAASTVGTMASCRVRPDLKRTVGPLANLVPIVTEVAPKLTFRDLLRDVGRTTAEGLARQLLPFSILRERLAEHRTWTTAAMETLFISEGTLATSAAALIAGLEDEPVAWGGLEVTPIKVVQRDAPAPLTVMVGEVKNSVILRFMWGPGTYAEDEIARLRDGFALAVRAASTNPDIRLDVMLSSACRRVTADPDPRTQAVILAHEEREKRPVDPELLTRLTDVLREVLGVEHLDAASNFFDEGGDSVLATRASARIRVGLGLDVSPTEILEAASLRIVAEMAMARARVTPATQPPTTPIERRLSSAEQRAWLIQRMDPTDTSYNLVSVYNVRGSLRDALLKEALSQVIKSHAVLRTTYHDAEDGPVAREMAGGCAWDVVAAERSELAALIREQAGAPFRLDTGPLLRCRIARIDVSTTYIIFVIHHTVFDGESRAPFLEDLSVRYSALVDARPAATSATAVRYADFALWQQSDDALMAFERQRTFWRGRLEGVEPVALPHVSQRSGASRFRAATIRASLNPETACRIATLCRAERVTPFTFYLAVCHLLLHRYTGAERVAVATPAAARAQPKFEPVIGAFVNTVVVVGELAHDPSFVAHLRRVWTDVLLAKANEDIPFEAVARHGVALPDERSALARVLFLFDPSKYALVHLYEDVELVPVATDPIHAKVDLQWSLAHDAGGGVEVTLTYRADAFETPTMYQMLRHYTELCLAAASSPESRASEYAIE